MRFLAGNIDLGTDTSANAATFVNVPRPVRDFGDPGSFVVLTDGRFFFRDAIRGLLVVDPRDGVQRIFIPTTGTASGDGGPAASATLRLPHRIALDHRQRILIFDYDRIRRVDTTVDPPTIETVIGGGSQADDGVRATEVAIDPPVVGDTLAPTYTQQMPLFALPNGDIYFQSNNYQAPPASGGRFRILRAATGRVQSLVVSGLDTQLTPGQDLALCSIGWLGVSYDLQSSVITHAQVVQEQTTVPTCATLAEDAMTRIEIASGIATPPHPGGLGGYLVRLIFPIQGMDGRLYALSRHRSMILVFDEAQNAFTPIVGTNELGSCPDGTAALSCDIDPSDVFVTRRGQLYFMERGLLRALDQRGNVVTVMGQPLSFGDGGAPLLARIHEVANLATRESGGRLKIVFLDGKQFRFREVSEGLSIDTIAGNGSNRTPALGAAAAAEPLLLDGGGVAWTHFGLDQGTGTVVFNRGFDRVAKLDRATGQWRDLVGGGTVPYLDADGQLGAAIALRDKNAYLPSVLALDGTDILVATEVYNETVRALEDIVIKTHRFADGRQGHLVGGRGLAANGYCADGTAVDLCLIPAARYQLRARREGPKSWLVGRPDTNSLYLVDAQAVNRYVLLPRGPTAFDVDLQGAFPVLYYCAAGKLYRYRMADSTETQLALPHPNMRCSGQGLDFVASRRSLVFGFSLHSLGGIAEYLGL